MAENLNVGQMIHGDFNHSNNGIIEKYCYGNSENQCNTYGGLYQWNEMMRYNSQGAQGICPNGWKIPTDGEWKLLEGYVDSQFGIGDPEWNETDDRGFDAGLNLKATDGWDNNGNGTDLFNFSALPGGRRKDFGPFGSSGVYGYWWSSSDTDIYFVWYRRL